MSEVQYSMMAAAQRAGLNPHIIRIWERRYGAVSPIRTSSNRRRYTEKDVERLKLLRHLTASGHSIGTIADLPTLKLLELAASDPVVTSQNGKSQSLVDQHQAEALAAIHDLDPAALEAALQQASIALGQQGLLEKLIAPLTQQLGELWRKGDITAAHEHFACAMVRNFLGNVGRPYSETESSARIVVATPTGQLHELGAVLVAAAARNMGWHVIYLGASLPAAEIAGAALQNRVKAVALSLVYPEDDQKLATELTTLRSHLPVRTRLIVGGRAINAYRDILCQIGAVQIPRLEDLYPALEKLRLPEQEMIQ